MPQALGDLPAKASGVMRVPRGSIPIRLTMDTPGTLPPGPQRASR